MQTFKKKERLSRKKHIQELFDNGSSFFLYPFKVLFLQHSHSDISTNQVLISVPRKNHKKAVSRNQIKRRIREAYRTSKELLPFDPENKLFIAYIYVSQDILPFIEIKEKLKESLIRLKNKDLN